MKRNGSGNLSLVSTFDINILNLDLCLTQTKKGGREGGDQVGL